MPDFYSGKRVLVAGGAGFIGSHLVEALVGRGAIVTVPARAATDTSRLAGVRGAITIVTAELAEREAARRAAAGQEIVFDLTMAKRGGIGQSARHHAPQFRDTLVPFMNILEAAREAGAERMLVMSSACVYPRDATIPMPEGEGFRGEPDPGNAGFGWAKRMEEYAAAAYAQEYGMNVAIARSFNAYGPRDNFFSDDIQVIPAIMRRITSGENPLTVWGSGRQTRSFIFVTDLVRGILDLCERHAAADPVNIGSSEEVTIGDLARLLVELMGSKTRVVFDSSKPEGHPRRVSDTRKAEETIGFQASVPLREGLTRTIEWYRGERSRRGE